MKKQYAIVDRKLVVLEKVEKPGNLGAILRTADAAGVDAILLCDQTTEIFNPNVIRSSLGCVFSVPVVACTTHEAREWIMSRRIMPFAAALSATHRHFEADLTGPVAIVMGSEAEGLSALWLNDDTEQIKIPMYGKVDSLNVSTSAAIIIYEAVRQRLLANCL